MREGFFERLGASARAARSLLCVGLDPDPGRIPDGAEGALRHCARVVEQTLEHACCYKPNAAFWQQYGSAGLAALAELRRRIPPEVPVVYDVKCGDVPSTMRAHARAAFEMLGMDAVTAHPYCGRDSLAEVATDPERGVYVLCRTSNPGAADLQHARLGGEPLYLRVAAMVESLNQRGNMGLVVGATAPAQLAELRTVTSLPFLVPGVGAQGGDLEASLRAGWSGQENSVVVASSRAVLYSEDPGAQARALKERINSLLTFA